VIARLRPDTIHREIDDIPHGGVRSQPSEWGHLLWTVDGRTQICRKKGADWTRSRPRVVGGNFPENGIERPDGRKSREASTLMSVLSKWWIGIVLLLIIWGAADIVMTERVESDLAARASAAVAAAASLIDRPRVVVAGRDLTLGGAAFTPRADEDAAGAAAATDGVRLLHDTIAPVPTAKPYVFAARRDGNDLVLTGHVPLPAVRAGIVAAARGSAAGVLVVDRTSYALGAPDNFAAVAAHGAAQAARLLDGTLSLSDTAYMIAGAAETSADYEAAMAAFRALPAGPTLAKADILPPEAKPYVLAITRDAASLSLSGSAPSIELRDAIVGRANRLFTSVVDRLEIARGAPTGDFAAAASFALAIVGKLASGTATLTDGHLSVAGSGRDGVTAETIAQDAGSLPEGFDLADDRVIPAAVRPLTSVK
jgi:OOP family OmpA-OmpF porin